MKNEKTMKPEPINTASGFFMPFFPSLDTLAGERRGFFPCRALSGKVSTGMEPSLIGGRLHPFSFAMGQVYGHFFYSESDQVVPLLPMGQMNRLVKI